MDYKKFELKVRMELLKREMTLTELANILGISAPYLSDIMKGKRDAKEQRKRIINILELEEWITKWLNWQNK